MGLDLTLKLHWTQRVALVRHNLHAGRKTGDFTFFKTLQAHSFIDGTDHVAILHSVLGPDADQVLSTLDNLNAGIAYVHQDAFKAVYDSAKSTMYKVGNSPSSRRSLLRVDISQQRDMSDHAIDKTTNSAISLIEAQPVHCQDAVANAWITGTTIIADAVYVCLNEMENIEEYIDDFIRLEYSWSTIQNSVDAAVSALRGIFNLMSGGSSNASRGSFSSDYKSETNTNRSRNSSTASALSIIKRAFTHNHGAGPSPRTQRAGSLPVDNANPRGLRLSMSAACPTKIPTNGSSEMRFTPLTTIPPTPSIHDNSIHDGISPFKETKDYFTFNIDKDPEASKRSSLAKDLMHLENLDPLHSPVPEEEFIKMPVPLTLRRLSESFNVSSPSDIAVVH